MKVINNLEELEPYYNKKTNTYEFVENGTKIDVEFRCHLNILSHILAKNINARNINTLNINAMNINAWDINARNINAWDIKALNIDTLNIKAMDISYHAVCFAVKNIECKSIKGRRYSSKHFVLDGDITIKQEEKIKMKNYDTIIRGVNFTIMKNNKDEYFFKDGFKGYIYLIDKTTFDVYLKLLNEMKKYTLDTLKNYKKIN